MGERQMNTSFTTEDRMCNILSIQNQYTMEVETT